jgi:hypothetical protein
MTVDYILFVLLLSEKYFVWKFKYCVCRYVAENTGCFWQKTEGNALHGAKVVVHDSGSFFLFLLVYNVLRTLCNNNIMSYSNSSFWILADVLCCIVHKIRYAKQLRTVHCYTHAHKVNMGISHRCIKLWNRWICKYFKAIFVTKYHLFTCISVH